MRLWFMDRTAPVKSGPTSPPQGPPASQSLCRSFEVAAGLAWQGRFGFGFLGAERA